MKLPIDNTSETMPSLAAQEVILWKDQTGKLYICASDDGVDKYAVQLGKL